MPIQPNLPKNIYSNTVAWVAGSGLCLSCGACEAICPEGAIETPLIDSLGTFLPLVDSAKCTECGDCLRVCPGHGLPLKFLAEKYQPDANDDLMIGHWRSIHVGYARDTSLCERASSGGLITVAVLYLIESGLVDGAVLVHMTYEKGRPVSEAYLAYNRNQVLESQGSKYCPVALNRVLPSALASSKRFVLVGLPCHIEALRLAQEMDERYLDAFPYVLGSFCGGVKDFRATYGLIRAYGFGGQAINSFSYRGGGWPGYLTITSESGRTIRRPYPQYGGDAVGFKLVRCTLCIDGTSELADLSLGDAWLKRYMESGRGWSCVICRTEVGGRILQALVDNDLAYLEPLSREDLIGSQALNLESKKTRQAARRRLFTLFGQRVPSYDGGFPQQQTSLLFEVKVVVSKWLLLGSERSKLLNMVVRLLRFAKRSLLR